MLLDATVLITKGTPVSFQPSLDRALLLQRGTGYQLGRGQAAWDNCDQQARREVSLRRIHVRGVGHESARDQKVVFEREQIAVIGTAGASISATIDVTCLDR
jgi:hypothetical protein